MCTSVQGKFTELQFRFLHVSFLIFSGIEQKVEKIGGLLTVGSWKMLLKKSLKPLNCRCCWADLSFRIRGIDSLMLIREDHALRSFTAVWSSPAHAHEVEEGKENLRRES